MPCIDLALTGSGSFLVPLLIAGLLVIVGVLIVGRRRTGRASATLGLVVIGCLALAATGPAPAAQAAACGTTVNSLTITQTSTMTGMAPGAAPAAITGTVTNNGADETTITAITVSIDGVTHRAGAAPGTCDAGDFVLVEPRMPVGMTLDAGASAVFEGASIGFRSDLTNQDACKGSTVRLRYTTSE